MAANIRNSNFEWKSTYLHICHWGTSYIMPPIPPFPWSFECPPIQNDSKYAESRSFSNKCQKLFHNLSPMLLNKGRGPFPIKGPFLPDEYQIR
uniref:C4 protein n=1 Tax=East African cassava mosaic Cameroon virus TaxID=223262 RepID=A0A089FX37_9GEMI|nr:C4 protein [East African cassava mosaic Cameroon virus]